MTLLEPAHISLGYPWVRDPSVDAVLAAAASVPAGTVTLLGPELFAQDVRRRTVVHALLSDDAIPFALARALDAPLRTPHLSIARVRHNGSVAEVVERVAPLLPLTVRLDSLDLTVKTDTGWKTLTSASLG